MKRLLFGNRSLFSRSTTTFKINQQKNIIQQNIIKQHQHQHQQFRFHSTTITPLIELTMEPATKKFKSDETSNNNNNSSTTTSQTQTQYEKQAFEDESKFGISEYFGAHQYAISGTLKER